MRAGPLRDVWTAVQPDISTLRPMIAQGDKLLGGPTGARLTPRESSIALAEILGALVRRYADRPPPAQFRVISSPLVTWVWLGGILVFLGGLVAIWPAPDAAHRPGPGRLRRPRGPRARPRLAAARRRRGRRRPRPRRPAARGGRRVVPAQPAVRDDRRAGRRARAHAPRRPRGRRARRSTARSARRSSTAAPASSTRATGAAIDRQLRAEAVAILRELDELGPGSTRPHPGDTD